MTTDTTRTRFPRAIAARIRQARGQGHAPVSTSGSGLFRCQRCNLSTWLDVASGLTETPCAHADNPTRAELEDLAWRALPARAIGISKRKAADGSREFAFAEGGAFTWRAASALTDAELIAILPAHQRARIEAARAAAGGDS